MAATSSAGVEALHRLKLTEPLMFITPSPELASAARIASEHLFASLKPYTPKSPFDRLLIDSKFDAEQIWQQIDLQSQPLISSVRRQLSKFEKDPLQVRNIFKSNEIEEDDKKEVVLKEDKLEDEDEDEDCDDDVEDDEGEDDDVEDEDDDEMEEKAEDGGVETRFLKLGQMKKFMEDDEAREYGIKKDNKVVKKKKASKFEEDEDDEEEDDDEDEDEDELGVFGLTGEEEEDDSEAEYDKYDDFYTSNKKLDKSKNSQMNKKVNEKMEDVDLSEEENEDQDLGDEDDDDDDMASDDEEKKANLSTHEKQLLEQRAKIEQVEKENLEAKTWTMQGEVTATKRPKNSALEVDLDWERNAQPPPVITEEVSMSIEQLIMKRISEGSFDDVQKAPSLPSKGPREIKELDENQSKKGLGEEYADEYAQKTGLVSKALTFSDKQKEEAGDIFKKLCLKLDALSHFHFAPKPVIEDMSIQTNVPALAMEEIAPTAVSDAAMLAPEEVFSGKGDIKEEAELTQADRKRRRASKKRKFKAENAKNMAKKPRESTQTVTDGKDHSPLFTS
ncbi:M phase phosphoprotein 10 [Rutidosis leptorrhynchoides]|uniref:M phase phosphoprotein 10 n=1 Tax=Rutidosis leptorrhynchoides TaxID=125765 RepID=UPI003A98E36F